MDSAGAAREHAAAVEVVHVRGARAQHRGERHGGQRRGAADAARRAEMLQYNARVPRLSVRGSWGAAGSTLLATAPVRRDGATLDTRVVRSGLLFVGR